MKREAEGVPRGPTPPPGVAWPGPRQQVVWPPLALLRLVFWLLEFSGEIGFLAYFPGFFLIVDFLHKK